MKNWQNLFQSRILDRGYEYYMMGMVNSIERSEFGYTASVEGTSEYQVDIFLEEDEIVDMQCNCPYAEDGHNCKHMVAVLFEIDDSEVFDIEDEEEGYEEKENLEEIVNAIPDKELKTFLISLARKNEIIENEIYMRFSSFNGNQLQSILSQVDMITEKYSHRGYIDYFNAWDYGWEMSSYLKENVPVLISRMKLKEAFQLVNKVFTEVASQDLDDSDGIISMTAQECVDYWKELFEKADSTFQKEMFHSLAEILNSGLLNGDMEESIEEVLTEIFEAPSVQKDKIEYIDSRIKDLLEGYKKDDFSKYKLSFFIKQRLLSMHDLGYSEKEIREVRNQFRFLSEIRQMEIYEYIEKENYEKAEESLLESIELDKRYPGLVDDYKRQLIDLYQKMNNLSAYKTLLKDYVLCNSQHGLEYILQLKSISSQNEWNEYRESIIQNNQTFNVSYKLLEKEEDYERLLKEIIKSNRIYLLDDFEKVLKKNLPEQTKLAYCDYVVAFAKVTNNRKMYRELVQYLMKIKTYPNSENDLDIIVSHLKERYRNRPAMMDELRKAGFSF